MSNKKELDWRRVIFEAGAIVFAVLLALWVEDWWAELERQERADLHLERIRAEIADNRDSLISVIEEHQGYIAGLEAALEDDDIRLERIGDFLRAEAGAVSGAAWQTAQLSQSVGNMPFETVSDLAGLYDTQSYYTSYMNSFFQRYVDLIADIERGDGGPIPVRNFTRHLEITNGLAEQLMEGYNEFLGEGQEE